MQNLHAFPDEFHFDVCSSIRILEEVWNNVQVNQQFKFVGIDQFLNTYCTFHATSRHALYVKISE